MARILTTHAGSLTRPKTLVHMLAAKAGGEEVNEAALEREVEAASAGVIAKQIASGVDIINDGEAGRESFFTYVRGRMTGFAGQGMRKVMSDITMYPTFLQHMLSVTAARENVSLMAPPQAVGDVAYKDDHAIKAEFARLRRLTGAHKPAGVFMTAAAWHRGGDENKHYGSLAGTSPVGRAQRRISHDRRARIHAADRCARFSDGTPHAICRRRLRNLTFSRAVVAAINSAIEGLPRERVRLHVCWGNYNGPHECDEPIESLWPVLETAKVGAYVISLANPRHEHEIAFFKGGRLPKGATLIAGVIDTTTNYVEHPRVVADRLERGRGGWRPQACDRGHGLRFETSAGFVTVAEEVVWAKLRALRDGAALASKRLMG
jgi:5-methyltetrahydropteroyltriglutamate--homocysteine methyltransferase